MDAKITAQLFLLLVAIISHVFVFGSTDFDFERQSSEEDKLLEVTTQMNGKGCKPVLESEDDPRLEKYMKIAEKPVLKAELEIKWEPCDLAMTRMSLFSVKSTPANLLIDRIKKLMQLEPLFSARIAADDDDYYEYQISFNKQVARDGNNKSPENVCALTKWKERQLDDQEEEGVEFPFNKSSLSDFDLKNRRASNLTMGLFTLVFSMIRRKGFDSLITEDMLQFIWNHYGMSELVKGFKMDALLEEYRKAREKVDFEMVSKKYSNSNRSKELEQILKENLDVQSQNDEKKQLDPYQSAVKDGDLPNTSHKVKPKYVREMYYLKLLPKSMQDKEFIEKFYTKAKEWEQNKEKKLEQDVISNLDDQALFAIAHEAFVVIISDAIEDFERSGADKDLDVNYLVEYIKNKLNMTSKRMLAIINNDNRRLQYESGANDVFDVSLLPKIFRWSGIPKVDRDQEKYDDDVIIAARELLTYGEMLKFLFSVAVEQRLKDNKMPKLSKSSEDHIAGQSTSIPLLAMLSMMLEIASSPYAIYNEPKQN